MCGIFGQVGEPLSDTSARQVVGALRHRGPEAFGVERLPGNATLVHTRLRILDLSPAGAQPMTNEDRSVWVTFNGEIYNFEQLRRELEALGHTFRSRSDTEVIVHGYEAWGDDVVRRLDGMFALGVWDERRRRLLLARDRTGKKPLFFHQRGDHLSFASEIKALFAAGLSPEVDPQGLAGYLAYGYVPPPGTFYRGVQQLPPASRLVFVPGQAPVVDQYWAVDFTPRANAPTEAEAQVRVRELLEDAVRRRMIADVPVGAFLSGGVDSTIIVGLMARLGHKVRTFSIGFAGDPRYDETHYARIAARTFGTDHTEFTVRPNDFDVVEKLVWHHDGPFGDSSAIPTYIVSRLTREHVTVALTGDGGDELFAGYSRFWAGALADRVPTLVRRAGGQVARLLPASLPGRSLPGKARRFLLSAELPLADRMTRWNSFFAYEISDLLRPEIGAQVSPQEVLQFQRRFFNPTPGSTALSRILRHNFETYLPYDLLVKMDRTSMAHALEGRSPFLDTALIEYVAGLPDAYKLKGRTTKYILRRACADLLPDEIQRRGKMGFGVPLGTWFRGDLRGYLRDLIGSPTSRVRDYLRPERVEALLGQHESGSADHQHQLWALLTLELSLRNLPRLASAWTETAAA